MNPHSSAPPHDPSDNLLDAVLAQTLVPPALSPDFQARLYAALARENLPTLADRAVRADMPRYIRRDMPGYGRVRFVLGRLVHVALCCGMLNWVTAGTLGFVSYPGWWRTYITRTETQKIALPQGGSITVDAWSELDLRLGRFVWDVRLTRGRASFDLPHDPSRQLTVEAGDVAAIDSGTRFQVTLRDQSTEVLTTEGVVEGDALGLGGTPNTKSQVMATSPIRAGEIAWTERAGDTVQLHVSALRPGDIQRRTSWASGYLIFGHEPLPQVVARFSRYTRWRITVDRSVRDVTLSGVVKIGDVATFKRQLQELHPELTVLDVAPDETLIMRH
jgi:ferric-dicitrate binding protein FerR (iron transport regulator)